MTSNSLGPTAGARVTINSENKPFRRRSTSFLQNVENTSSTETLQMDFDTRRDIRLDILHQERQEQAAEEGRRRSNRYSIATILSPSAPPRPSLTLGAKDGSDWIRDRFLRRGKRRIGVLESLKAIVLSSWLNVFFVFIPISWAFHFTIAQHHNPEPWRSSVTFAMSLMALVPLERLLEYGGDQMSLYCGKELGDLIIITLNNAVEATLAIILLVNCELRLLQSTVTGVILLHLLLVPGIAFIIGGAKLIYQSLNPHSAQLNHILLLMGVLTFLLPTALFNTIRDNALNDASISEDTSSPRDIILKISHGFAIILLVVYAYSRVFLYNPPGENNAFRALPDAPSALLEEERDLLHEEPEVNQYVCIAFLLCTIAVMAPTAEWASLCHLVDSIEFVRADTSIQLEWFGLILLPLSSFAADAILAIGHFARTTARYFLGWKPPPTRVAKARSIDVSIQFNLFWLPLFILLGWCLGRPFMLLFDTFEVAILIGACFLVNFVTADARTNWAEGATMVTFYIMIALTAWFYKGDESVTALLNAGQCIGTGEL